MIVEGKSLIKSVQTSEEVPAGVAAELAVGQERACCSHKLSKDPIFVAERSSVADQSVLQLLQFL